MLTKIEHIALAVSNLDDAIAWYRDLWGLTLEHREVVEDQHVEEAMLRLGDSFIQLICPTDPTSTVAMFIDRRGEGLHHIAYEVEDIDEALSTLAARGARLIDATPRKGSRNTRIAFVHPADNRGVLVELVERIKPETIR